MTNVVSDIASNTDEILVNSAKFLKQSSQRRAVFKAIYSGKRIKKISEIETITGLSKVRVAQECQKLRGRDIVELYKENNQIIKIDGEKAYIKKDFFNLHKNKILKLATNKKSLEKIKTKSNPNISLNNLQLKIKLPSKHFFPKIQHITIEEIDQFKKIRKIVIKKYESFYEKDVKNKFKRLIGERGNFTDWGGEKNELREV